MKREEEKGLEFGMQAHIAKPVDIAVLTQTLQDVLSGNQ